MYFSFLFGRQNTTRRTSRPSRRNGKRQHARRPILERLENRSLLAGFPIVLGGTGTNDGWSLATDTSGNVLLAGKFAGTIDFDPGSGTANLTSTPVRKNNSSYDGFLAKYSPGGDFLWARRFGEKSNDRANSVKVDPAGNAYIVGTFTGSTNITGLGTPTGTYTPYTGPSITSHSNGIATDALVVKFDPSGSVQWVKQFGGDNGTGYAENVSIHTTGGSVDGVYVSGNFAGTVDFDPDTVSATNLTSAGLNDAYVVKLNGDGNFVPGSWAMRAGSTGDDWGYDIAVAADGSAYVSGGFSGSVQFGSTILSSVGGADGFVAKLASDTGVVTWVRRIGGAGAWDRAYKIRVTADSVFVSGGFETATGGVTFDSTTLYGFGGGDAFVSKLNAADGSFQWTKQFGGQGYEMAVGVAIDALNNVDVTGYFYTTTADFDPGPNQYFLTPISQDAFVVKLDKDGNFAWAKQLSGGNFVGRDITWDPVSNSVFVVGTLGSSVVRKLDSSTGLPMSALLAAAPAPADVPNPLSLSQVPLIVEEALARWQTAGADVSTAEVKIQIRNTLDHELWITRSPCNVHTNDPGASSSIGTQVEDDFIKIGPDETHEIQLSVSQSFLNADPLKRKLEISYYCPNGKIEENQWIGTLSVHPSKTWTEVRVEKNLEETWDNGNLKATGKTMNGARFGEWHFYNEQGDRIRIEYPSSGRGTSICAPEHPENNGAGIKKK